MNKYILYLLSSVLISSFSQILLKKSALKKYDSKLKEYINLDVFIAYFMFFTSTILTLLAFKGLDYKNGPIIESLGYVAVMILSFIFFGEKLTYKKIIGNALIILGIFIFYL